MKTKLQTEAGAYEVDSQLMKICRKLAIVEANVELLSKMTKNCVATEDVRNFMDNQRSKHGVRKSLNKKAIKNIMSQKYRDASVVASRLRQDRCRLRKECKKKVPNRDWKNMEKEIEDDVSRVKNEKRVKNSKKYESCMRKQERIDAEDKVPEGVFEMIKDINVFCGEVEREKSSGPMICSKEIVLSECEKKFLEKGPKFMWRMELDTKEFMVEIEKMVMK